MCTERKYKEAKELMIHRRRIEELKPEIMGKAVRTCTLEGKFVRDSLKISDRTAYSISGFPIILQMPELRKGCEITALTMVLNFYGYQADKSDMAFNYLPKMPENLRYGPDGRLYGSDLNQYFIGDPSGSGHVCGSGAIVTAANMYLEAQGSSWRAVSRDGTLPDQLYEIVCQGIPVIVWVTIGMQDRRPAQGWYTETGGYVDWSTNDHTAVLIGYTGNTVRIADPLAGIVEYDRQRFEEAFASRSRQCVILQ